MITTSSHSTTSSSRPSPGVSGLTSQKQRARFPFPRRIHFGSCLEGTASERLELFGVGWESTIRPPSNGWWKASRLCSQRLFQYNLVLEGLNTQGQQCGLEPGRGTTDSLFVTGPFSNTRIDAAEVATTQTFRKRWERLVRGRGDSPTRARRPLTATTVAVLASTPQGHSKTLAQPAIYSFLCRFFLRKDVCPGRRCLPRGRRSGSGLQPPTQTDQLRSHAASS